MKVNLEAYLPIWEDDEESIISSNIVIAELSKLSNKIYLPLDQFNNGFLSFEPINSVKNKSFLTKCPWLVENKDRVILKITSIIEIDVDDFDELSPELMKHIGKKEFLSAFCASLFRDRLFNFITFVNLAKPGFISTRKGAIFKNGKFWASFKSNSTILPPPQYRDFKWPTLIELSIEQVWNYIIQNTNILANRSKSKIETALNAFSYLFEDIYNTPSNFFWAVTGIEALYTEGEIGISFQIDQKVQLFLGEIKSDKKRLKKMYNFRSRLIHGDIEIPIYHGFVEQEKYEFDLDDESNFAAVVLTASLQKIISENRKQLEFSFIYK